MAIYAATNASELYAALSSAQGGDRIELAGGDYGNIGFGHAFASDVTIVSVDFANPAIIRDLLVRNASHLVFDGILFDYTLTGNNQIYYLPFEVRDSSYITFRNSVFAGDPVREGKYGTGIGLSFMDVEHTIIENNEFFHWYKAIAGGRNTDMVIRGNDIRLINVDGVVFTSVDGMLIEDNHFHDWLSEPGMHRDMIQSWTKLTETSSQNVTIRGNFFDAGLGEQTQTIFLRNNIYDTGQGSFEDFAFRNFLLEDNIIYNANGHGMTIGATDGLVVRDNTLLYDPYTAGVHTLLPPQIRLKPGSANVSVEGNILHNAPGGESSWVTGENFIVQRDNPSASNFYGNLFVNALIQAPTLADLRALPGGLIETRGLGAKMTRFDIALVVGPAPGSEPAPIPDPVPDPAPDPEPDMETAQMEFLDLIVNLIDSTDNTVKGRLLGGEYLDPVFLASGVATIGIDLASDTFTVGSMRLTVGGHTRTEGVAPYALYGDQNGDFTGGLTLAEGDHMLRIEVFADGGAQMGDFTVAFSVGVEPVQMIDPAVQDALDALELRVAKTEEKIAAGAAGLGG